MLVASRWEVYLCCMIVGKFGCFVISLRTLAGSSSGPVALFWFRCSSCFITSSMQISRRGMLGVIRGGYLGDGVLFLGKYRAKLVV